MSGVLPELWMDRIWQRLTVRYGQAFLGRWAGVDLADVKADWAEQLAGFTSRPDCIKYALENLPDDKPPTVAVFKALCNAMPEPNVLKLSAPRSAPPAEVIQAIKTVFKPGDAKAWAYCLQGREAAGEKLSSIQRRFWREALGVQQ